MRAILAAMGLASLLLLGCARAAKDAGSAPAPEAPATEAAPGTQEFAAPPPAPAAQARDNAEEESRAEGLPKDEGSSELELAQADLRRAQAELDAVLPDSRRERSSAGAAPAPRASRPAETDDAAAPKAKPEKKAAESSCATACRAFGSLGRAAGAVCRLAGENDTRCTQAKEVVSDAEKRVASCRCRTE